MVGRNYEEVFDSPILTASELILEKNNIDFENKSLYLGYIVGTLFQKKANILMEGQENQNMELSKIIKY